MPIKLPFYIRYFFHINWIYLIKRKIAVNFMLKCFNEYNDIEIPNELEKLMKQHYLAVLNDNGYNIKGLY